MCTIMGGAHVGSVGDAGRGAGPLVWLGSQAGKIAEQGSDTEAVSGIFFVPRILISALMPQMLGWVLHCPLLMV